MTTADRVRCAVEAELAIHAALMDSRNLGLRAVRIDVKLTKSGEVRAAVVNLEFEREALPASNGRHYAPR